MEKIKITQVQFIPCHPDGTFLGFANIIIDGWLELNGIGVHAVKTGIDIKEPARKLKNETLKFYFKIHNDEIKEEIRAAVEENLYEVGFFGAKIIKEE
ncbi:unnamed protein product [marine sediment metagenome]|uniref:Uncharacterized protein n=1 Tax=marine sediment metagenome TaxID=412755 RepID=X1TE69_9ZZZZ